VFRFKNASTYERGLWNITDSYVEVQIITAVGFVHNKQNFSALFCKACPRQICEDNVEMDLREIALGCGLHASD
jgi:hypothetical protein